ncbi:MAG: hypothetical protein AB8G05_07450 [Oligoflexales bacterium]
MKALNLALAILFNLQVSCLASTVKYGDMRLDWVRKASEKTRVIANFPKPGILFQDVLGIFQDPGLLREITSYLSNQYKGRILLVSRLEDSC